MDSQGMAAAATTEETDLLIASDKVEGTAVYNRQGGHLGALRNFMVNKSTGQVAYAVMSFGGFLGVGESYHPRPWRALTYDPTRAGFVIDLDRGRLEKAPSYTADAIPNWADRTYGSQIDEHYGLSHYWGTLV